MVVGGTHAPRMLQRMERLKIDATTFATIADRVHTLLPIRNRVDKSGLCRSREDFFRFVATDLPAEAVVANVVGQFSEMEAGLRFVFAIRAVGIHIVSVPARAGGNRESILFLQHLPDILVREYASGIFDGLSDGKRPQPLCLYVFPVIAKAVLVVAGHA